MRCQHCQAEIFSPKNCPECNQFLMDQCPECHAEVSHGAVPWVSVKVVSNAKPPMHTTGVQYDPDATGSVSPD